MSEKIKVSLTAVIPVYQYANLQPTVEVEADTFEEARDKAMAQIKTVWDSVSEGGKSLDVKGVQTSQAKLVTKTCDFTGSKVLMDEEAHKYFDGNGNPYQSGSSFAHRFKTKFEAGPISGKMAGKYGVSQQDILDMWSKNAEASTSLGTAIHAGLELYGKYLELSQTIKGTNESALHKNPIVREAVEKFFKGRENEKALYESFAANVDKRMCGFIDRLLFVDVDNNVVRIQDYKTNPDIRKKETILAPFKGVVESSTLGAYWLQLSFYAYILEKAGYTVQGLDIFNYVNGEWVTYSNNVVDISGAI
jgi:hypothetical protein